jgi:predicted transcriptional regulator
MPTPAKELLDAVRAILVRALTKPLTQKEVAELLGVQSKQASTWLNALVEQRALTKMKRPTRYVASRSQTNGG